MKDRSINTVPLSFINLSDSSNVGNKAATLGELLRQGLNVPDGFCVTTDSFKTLVSTLSKSFSFDRSTSTFSRNRTKLAGKILRSNISSDLFNEVQSALSHICLIENAPALFCTRSSAPVEDSPDHSFAGQFHTSIGLVSLDDVIHGIKKCWASLFQEQVISYIDDLGIDINEASMAVLVQALVPAEKSGVLFTCDPLTGESVFLVEATWGLGSPLVGGQITPDYIRMRPSGEIIKHTVGSKKHALLVTDRGAEETILEPIHRDVLCITEKELDLLQKAAIKIIHILGTAQDVEFAFFNQKLWILQSRPITGMQRSVKFTRFEDDL